MIRPMFMLTAALGLLATKAHAETSPAQALFEEGRTLVLEKHFDEACPKLAESLRLERGIGTALWLADCLEKSGDLDGAWTRFHEAADIAAQAHDDREAIARRRQTSLEVRVARHRLVIAPDDAELSIQRDGVLVPANELGHEVAIKAGVHTFTAAAKGRQPWSAVVEITARPGAVVVNVPVLAAEPAVVSRKVEEPRTEVRPAPSPAIVQHVDALSGKRIAAIAVASVGVVAVGAGTYFGLRARSTYDGSNADGHCTSSNVCDATGKALRSDAKGQALVSTVGFAAGAAGLGAGVLLWVLGAPERVVAGPGQIGLGYHQRF